ncbi:threonine synthase [uncultured Legionella sp.]|uniref:threonine synthase n=1 Tax=uncultured Legionella sp. TaxID=210934 RepID=UPI002604885C|nr:threonine synthase [uncultured Legionella sp.]
MKNKWRSTRGMDVAQLDDAILAGLARDGGLYVPEQFPELSIDQFYEFDNLVDFSRELLASFFKNSKLVINRDFCQEVFHFPMPITGLTENSYVLELFHGPTLSFKDFGARFFAQCLQNLVSEVKTKVLVATSGDTGSAVASALHGRSGIEGIILFPKDKISLRQQMQITCWSDNITALAVKGNFDQCQQLVKSACSKSGDGVRLTTANSINIARLLPQMVYYAYSSIQLEKIHHETVNFIVPGGNLGNVTACYWAQTLGFPINEILIANNANKVLSDYLSSGIYEARPSINTLANAMDVGDPSNLERLIDLFGDFNSLEHHLNALSVFDEEIKEAITDCYNKYKYILCPHTATAYHRLQRLDSDKIWVIAATAHPVKFNDLIEPLLGLEIPVPEQLKIMMERTSTYQEIEAQDVGLKKYLNLER